jgi:hypothetical protein
MPEINLRIIEEMEKRLILAKEQFIMLRGWSPSLNGSLSVPLWAKEFDGRVVELDLNKAFEMEAYIQ